MRAGMAAAALAIVACQAVAPDADPLTGGAIDAGAPYADVVIAYTIQGQAMSCGDTLPQCGAAATCGPTAALGPPDQVDYELPAGGVLELALRCSFVMELGGINSADLKLWADIPQGSAAVIEVSVDGAFWHTLGPVQTSDATLDLESSELDVIRFVRISDGGAGGIRIDAVEGLR